MFRRRDKTPVDVTQAEPNKAEARVQLDALQARLAEIENKARLDALAKHAQVMGRGIGR